jgi:hypothetical protein
VAVFMADPVLSSMNEAKDFAFPAMKPFRLPGCLLMIRVRADVSQRNRKKEPGEAGRSDHSRAIDPDDMCRN